MTRDDLLLWGRYVYPCAVFLNHSGKMSNEILEEIKQAVTENKPLDEDFFKTHFPKAFEESRRFLSAAEYWHQHIGADGLCAVKKRIVTGIETDGTVVVHVLSKVTTYNNTCGLSLEIGEVVFTHFGEIIEKADGATAR